MKKITIAIDGPAASGKSTTAKEAAKILKYTYIDTGAMYRAAALAFIRMNLDFTDKDYLKLMDSISIELKQSDNGQLTFLNGEDVSNLIRTPEVTKMVSPVSANAIVRERLIDMQRRLGIGGGIIMDGRDIGTVVFPKAELKIFMIASAESRAERRTKEMLAAGLHANYEEIKNNLIARDKFDTEREHSPLKPAPDAILIDTTKLSITEQTQLVVDLANQLINQNIINNTQ